MPRSGDPIGPYILISKLGRGAFGTVWLSERRTTIATTTAALKIPLDDDIDLETIKQEANLWILASGHPNVLPIIEANIYDDQVVIASEYAPDGSLEGWLKQQNGNPPSIEAVVEIMSGILSGLEHLHARNIIHRDLKPANILFQGKTPRLADFGISRVLKSTSQSNIVAGTPAYMAPEAFDGKRNEQTDIWSAGVLLYQMLTGRLPFLQADITSLIGAILARNPDPLPASIPSPFHEVVARALAKDPSRRYKSAAEMRAALRNNPTANREARYDTETVITPPASPSDTIPPDLSSSAQLMPQGKSSRYVYTIIALMFMLILGLLSIIVVPLMLRDQKQDKNIASQTTKSVSASANTESPEASITTLKESQLPKSPAIVSNHSNPISPSAAATLVGRWHGQWTSSKGGLFDADLVLEEIGTDNGVQGVINWTLERSVLESKQSKIGLTATEFVKGSYNPMTRALIMEGYRKNDPNNIINLDKYRLVLAEAGKSLEGATWNHGNWGGRLSLSR